MSEQTKKAPDYTSTKMRIAGNIAAGLVGLTGTYRPDSNAMRTIVAEACEAAELIVKHFEVK
jgi:hypothetical protein